MVEPRELHRPTPTQVACAVLQSASPETSLSSSWSTETNTVSPASQTKLQLVGSLPHPQFSSRHSLWSAVAVGRPIGSMANKSSETAALVILWFIWFTFPPRDSHPHPSPAQRCVG